MFISHGTFVMITNIGAERTDSLVAVMSHKGSKPYFQAPDHPRSRDTQHTHFTKSQHSNTRAVNAAGCSLVQSICRTSHWSAATILTAKHYLQHLVTWTSLERSAERTKCLQDQLFFSFFFSFEALVSAVVRWNSPFPTRDPFTH